jgi:hypothetical protein
MELSRDILRQRHDMYLADHYLSTHVTIVSLAFGAASVAVASLLAGPKPEFVAYQPIFYMLWLVSGMAVVVAYAGAAVGSVVLPARIPAIVDLLLPLLVGVPELVLFTILAYRVTGWTSPRAVLIGWWLTLAGFCFMAFLHIWRVRHVTSRTTYHPDVQPLVQGYLERLRSNMFGSFGVGTMSIVIGVIDIRLFDRLKPEAQYIGSALGVLGFVLALVAHKRTANQLRSGIASLLGSDVAKSSTRVVDDRA